MPDSVQFPPQLPRTHTVSTHLPLEKMESTISLSHYLQKEEKPQISSHVFSDISKVWNFLDKKISRTFNYAIKKGKEVILPTKAWFKEMYAHWEQVSTSPDYIQYKPVGGQETGTYIGSDYGNMLFSSSIYGALSEFFQVIGSTLNIKNALQMIIKGRDVLESATAHSHIIHAKKMVKRGIKNLVLGKLTFISSTGAAMRSVANLVLQAGTAAHAATFTVVVGVGTTIAAPISFCLCAYGAKHNVSRIRRTSAQLVLIDQELARLQEQKLKLYGGQPFPQNAEHGGVNLREREDILLFAKRSSDLFRSIIDRNPESG